ncbi:MAG: GT4 family glycosyltransferase PelF [Candidatus Omnitrophica bacterium]|nr:GT4 family glycosyltransferase PelF [Candidatus Omnitrophota bacterium]
MKILQILPELNVGGVETGTVDFAKYLVEHGHSSVVISNGGGLVKNLIDGGTKHYQLPVHSKNLATAIFMIKKVRQIILDEKIDIVHARSRVPGWIAYFAAKKTPATFITTCHGFYKHKWYSRIMGWSKLVIVPSRVIGRHMIDTYKVPATNIRCIPRSVDLDRFSKFKHEIKMKTDPVIAIVGRLTPIKGHTFFIKAMAKVIRVYPYAKIRIIGDAPVNKQDYKNEVALLVKRLGISSNVEFLGNRQDVPELLAGVDVLAVPSITQESFGRTIIEAQAVGVPVVATEVGGVVDIIEHQKNGWLVPPKDVDAMATAVLQLLKDRELCERMVAEAQKKIDIEYTLEKMATRTLAVYEEILGMKNILVVKFSSVGDVVLITVALKSLRQKFPKAKIFCVVGKEHLEVLQDCPYIDDIIVYDRKLKHQKLWKFAKFCWGLRKLQLDIVIDFQNNHRSHWLAFLTDPKESYGFCNQKAGKLLTNGLKNYRDDIPPVEHQFQILKMLGIEYSADLRLELWPSKYNYEYVQELLDSEWLGTTKNIVGINLAASEKWKTKNLPLKHVAALSDILSTKGIRVIFTGMEKDAAIGREISRLCLTKPANFAGKTDMMQLAALISRCVAYVTPDSAPLHVAAAMNVPVVAVFGPTSDKRHVPPASKIIILTKQLECAPCYSPECLTRKHDCMNAITPQDIADAIFKIIEGK